MLETRIKIMLKKVDNRISEELKNILNAREAESLAGKNSNKNWEEIKASIKSQKREGISSFVKLKSHVNF
jgi:hypothetical protein